MTGLRCVAAVWMCVLLTAGVTAINLIDYTELGCIEDGEVCYYMFNDDNSKFSWQEAKRDNCPQATLPVIYTEQQNTAFVELLREHNITDVYLGASLNDNNEENGCEAYDYSTNTTQIISCNEQLPAVCNIDYNIVRITERHSWHDAQYLCESCGGTLLNMSALLMTSSQNESSLAFNQLAANNETVWLSGYIGEWIWNEMSQMLYTNWGEAQPDTTDHCSAMSSDEGRWFTVQCTGVARDEVVYTIVCQQGNSTTADIAQPNELCPSVTEVPEEPTSTPENIARIMSKSEQTTTEFIIGMAALGVGIVIVVIVVLIVIIMRRKRGKHKEVVISESNTDVENADKNMNKAYAEDGEKHVTEIDYENCNHTYDVFGVKDVNTYDIPYQQVSKPPNGSTALIYDDYENPIDTYDSANKEQIGEPAAGEIAPPTTENDTPTACRIATTK